MSSIKEALLLAATEVSITIDPELDEVSIAKILVEQHDWDSLDMVEATFEFDQDVVDTFFDALSEALQ